MEYSEVKEQIKQKLPVEKEFGDSDNLLELGLSSIVIMRLVNQWRKQGVKVAFGTLMEHPTLNEWWEIIQKSMKKKGKKAKAEKRERIPERDMREPFPLTDVQYAYWVGREDNQVLGGIGCHAYLEFDGNGVDPERLQEAWNRIQYHHPMLRASFSENGMQKIESKPYSEKIKINDFSLLTEAEAEQEVQTVRKRLSHRKLKIEEGEVAGIELTLFSENKTRLHIDLDLLIADVQSLQILLRDLAMVYSGAELPEESKDWNFATYLEQQNVEDREEREKAKEYWTTRLKNLPQGPDVPLAKRPEEVKNPVFHRRIVRIGKEEWDSLQRSAKEYQTTPAMLLLTAYSIILERWSKNKRFLINIPFFNRKTEYKGLEDVIADFTTLLLLEVNCEGNPTFLELLDRIQKQLHEDMKYTTYSGVQVQRDLTQIYIDTYGTSELKRELINRNIASSGCYILGAGVYPGLTGIALNYLVKKYPNIKRWKGMAGSCEPIAAGAAEDLLYSCLYGFGIENAYWKDGQIKVPKRKKIEEIYIAQIQKTKSITLFLPDEILQIAKENDLEAIRWYNVLPNKEYMTILKKVYQKLLQRYDIGKEIQEFEEITRKSTEHWNIISFSSDEEGVGQILVKFEISNTSAYKMTGIVAALLAIKITRTERKSGIWNAYETIDMQYVLDKLREEDVSIEEKQEVLVDNETSEETGIL